MSAGTPDIYERDGRRFVPAGMGTIGWGVYPLYKEVDFSGNVIDSFPKPLEWIFPDPAVVAEQKRREEEERQRLERGRDFPVEGMSAEHGANGDLCVWPTDGDGDESANLQLAPCNFCRETKPTLSLCDDCREAYVCRDCLGKMFDVFEAKEAVTA